MPVSSHNRSASLCSPSSFTFVLLLPLPFGRTDRSLQLLFYPRRTTLPQFSVFSLSLSLSLTMRLLLLVSPSRHRDPPNRIPKRTRERKRWKLLASWPFWQDSDYVVYRSVLWKKYSTGNEEIQDTSLIAIVDPSGGEEECE